jgi:hypothetical protein
MGIAKTGTLSMVDIGAEFGMTTEVSVASLYLGGGTVTVNSGSNLAIPSSGSFPLTSLRGTASHDQTTPVAVALPTPLATASNVTFRTSAASALAARLVVPASKVSVTSVTSADAGATATLTFAVATPVTATAPLAAIAAARTATDPTALFGAPFCAPYGLSNASVAAVTAHLAPLLLQGGHKDLAPTLSNPVPVVVRVDDLFAPSSTSVLPLSYALAANGNPRGNATIAGSNLTITGGYRGATYYVGVAATDATATAPSAPATVRVVEAAAPAMTTSAIPAVAALQVGACNVLLSPFFADPTGSSTLLAYRLLSNPYSNATVSGCNLSLVGASRNAAYTVVVGASNAWGVSASNSVAVTEPAGAVVSAPYPPAALSGPTATLAGYSAGNGTYTLTNSTSFGGAYAALSAFSYVVNGSDTWSSGGMLYNTGGIYVSTVSTTVSGVASPGEWLQIQLPTAIVLLTYDLWPYSVNPGRSPYTWKFCGSTNGTTWTLLDARTAVTGWTANVKKTFAVTGNSTAYAYFRIVAQATVPNVNNDSLCIGELRLYS